VGQRNLGVQRAAKCRNSAGEPCCRGQALAQATDLALSSFAPRLPKGRRFNKPPRLKPSWWSWRVGLAESGCWPGPLCWANGASNLSMALRLNRAGVRAAQLDWAGGWGLALAAYSPGPDAAI